VAVRVSEPVFYEGVCDASGAVPVNPSDPGDLRFLVADDEDDRAIIRMYDGALGGPPVRELSLSHKKLQLGSDGELDLEAAAWLKDRVYWVGSHGRDKKGKQDANRRRLVSTTMEIRDDKIDIRIAGQPYTTLVRDLRDFFSKQQSGLELDPKVPPKEGGLSIEGLAADPEQHDLLVGFRSPVFDGRALVVIIRNPDEITAEDAKPVEFGEPCLLDLNGLGVRSMEYWPSRKCYLVLAGAADKTFDYRFFTWKPGSKVRPVADVDFSTMNLPEGVAPESFFVHGSRIVVLFDEGNRKVNGKKCKKSNKPSFRSIALEGLR
jgi:hypothetical protein